MSAEGVDLKKRRTLTLATSAVGAVGAGFVIYPFLAAWAPSEKAKAAGAPVEAEIGKLEPGQMMSVKWRGKPVWIVRRTERNLQGSCPPWTLSCSTRPPMIRGSNRTIARTRPVPSRPEYLVAVGICTHLGCSPTYRRRSSSGRSGRRVEGWFLLPMPWFTLRSGRHVSTAACQRRKTWKFPRISISPIPGF